MALLGSKVARSAIASFKSTAQRAADSNAQQALSSRKRLWAVEPDKDILAQLDNHGIGYVKELRFGRRPQPSKNAKADSSEKDEVCRRAVRLPRPRFVAGAFQAASIPASVIPEVAFIGRSNVGKSSLVNALGGPDVHIARTSDAPGLTHQLNFYRIDAAPAFRPDTAPAGRAGHAGAFHLVDMPGYGFAFAKDEAREAWQNLIDEYLKTRRCLKRLFVLLDSRHGIKQIDRAFFEKLSTHRVKFQVVLTKCDLELRPVLAKRATMVMSELAKIPNAIPMPLLVSAHKGSGVDHLRRHLLQVVGAGHLVADAKFPWRHKGKN